MTARRGALVLAVAVTALALAGARGPARAHDPKPTESGGQPAPAKPAMPGMPGMPSTPHNHGQAGHQHGGAASDHDSSMAHVHAPLPPEYQRAHVPAAAWTNPRMLARGKEIYETRCAVCHGDQGDGKGPAGLVLPVKPASFHDQMVNEMAGNYWFWRVSEGGTVEPFRSMGSAMPAWKDQLSVEDRWAVIAYAHRFSGHEGPHVTSEHPEMVAGGHGAHGAADAAAPAKPRSSVPVAPAATGSHRH